MAAYSFIPPGSGTFGDTLGGYGSLGVGQGLMNAMGSGLNLAQGFRRYQNDNILDQYRIPAQAAEATGQMWNGDFNALRASTSEALLGPLMARSAQPGPIVDQNGNLVSHPVGAGANQNGAPYTGIQPFMGAVQSNTIDGGPQSGVSSDGTILGQYLTTPAPAPQQGFDPRYFNPAYAR